MKWACLREEGECHGYVLTGRADSRQEAMAAAEEVARCLGRCSM